MAVRLGLSLPQTRQYDIGRDVPDVARAAEADRLREPVGVRARPVPRTRDPGPVRHGGRPLARRVPRPRRPAGDADAGRRGHLARPPRHQRAGRPAARPLPTGPRARHVGRGERRPGRGGPRHRLVPRRVRRRRGGPVRGARPGPRRGPRRVPGGLGPGPGAVRGPPDEDRVGRRRPQARPADPDPPARLQQEVHDPAGRTRRRLEARSPWASSNSPRSGSRCRTSPPRRAAPRPLRDGGAGEPRLHGRRRTTAPTASPSRAASTRS